MPLLPLVVRRLFPFILVVAAALGSVQRVHAANPPAAKPLRVCLVSGANDSAPYATDRSLAGLAAYLEKHHGMTCQLVTWDPAKAEFDRLERLLEADAAVFFVRRKTPNARDLDVLKRFFASGHGFVALRSTSHAWENWPEFDAEVLGAKYGGPKGGNFGNAEKLIYRPHPIWEGAGDFDTQCDLYRYGPTAPDVTVLLEGQTQNGLTPVAWTRPLRGGRLFHLALGYAYDVEKPSFRRIVANALRWVSEPGRK
jgi:type 1 glutamine amidotransferase